MASPWRAPRSAAAAGRRPVFPFFGRECRILVRAHGSVAPGSSCPGGDSHSSPGRSRSGSLQESIAASLSDSRPWFSPAPRGAVQRSALQAAIATCAFISALRPTANHDSQSESLGQYGWSLLFRGYHRCHQLVAPWPLLALPLWPLRSAPPTLLRYSCASGSVLHSCVSRNSLSPRLPLPVFGGSYFF